MPLKSRWPARRATAPFLLRRRGIPTGDRPQRTFGDWIFLFVKMVRLPFLRECRPRTSSHPPSFPSCSQSLRSQTCAIFHHRRRRRAGGTACCGASGAARRPACTACGGVASEYTARWCGKRARCRWSASALVPASRGASAAAAQHRVRCLSLTPRARLSRLFVSLLPFSKIITITQHTIGTRAVSASC